ncbi:MAG: pyridoxamine 5'-phosphate oxidase family protein [Gammaproteobacteria bacterium]|nr:pyridoxamine 5'-phosphate oxidase family protein [Gammaproteobacteria bacterium]
MAADHLIKNAGDSPFHRGEREIQSRLGVREQMEHQGSRFIRDHLPEQHREFYRGLPFVLIGTVDEKGRPWASILFGRPGFADSPDARTLTLASRPVFGDPLNDNLVAGLRAGLLGIEYHSRRRNRLNARVAAFDDKVIQLDIDQAFGNCPRYIQTRDYELLPGIDLLGENKPVQRLGSLNSQARAIIEKADHFYIASYYSEDEGKVSHGADVSHRGGKPGFVRVDDDNRLTFPDFNGNLHYNTLGNISLNPRAGLLFMDFDSGDLLYLTCGAEIIWDAEERQAFTGAESLVRLTIDAGLIVEGAAPIRWSNGEQSPMLTETGSWQEVEEKIAARKQGNVYREYAVTRVEPESSNITSFYLQPQSGERVPCHKPGQFLPIEIEPVAGGGKLQRTYTISNAPNGREYRLSIKREPAPGPGLPAGVASNFFHDQVKVGSNFRAMSPRGKFTLDESTNRPVVMLSAGVGITPMLGMLEQLASDSDSCREPRAIWFLHGVRNGSEHAFASKVRDLEKTLSCLQTRFVYSQPGADDTLGIDYDQAGHIDVDLLRRELPFDDYDFYMCGPTPFMQSLYTGLKNLNVPDERIHYEFFGPGAAFQTSKPVALPEDKYAELSPVPVRFDRSGIETTWDPGKGSLLDLAESEGLQPDYSCRSGICQTCATRVVDGEVGYAEPPMVDPEPGMALLCCSHPLNKLNDDNSPLVLDL